MTEHLPDEAFLDLTQDIIEKLRDYETGDALTLIQQGIAKYPESAELFLLTSLCCFRQDDVGRAIELCETAHKLSPDCQEVVDGLAVLHVCNGNLNEGLYYAKLATTLPPHPDIPDLLPYEFSDFFAAMRNATPSRHYLDGLYRYNFQVFDEAAVEFAKELRRNPDNHSALKKLGQVYVKLNRPKDALETLTTYRTRVEEDAEAIAISAMAHCQLAEFEQAATLCKSAMATSPDSLEVAMMVLEASVFLDGALREQHNQFIEDLQQRIERALEANHHEPQDVTIGAGDVINVAIISNKLFEGDVATFLMPYLQNHDSSKFNVTVYQQSPAGGAVYSALKSAAPNWRRIVDVDDDVVDLISARERTDIVLDLCGFSENSRPMLFAMLGNRLTANIFCQPFGEGTPGTSLILSDAATATVDHDIVRDGQTLATCNGGLFVIDEPQVMGAVGNLPAARNGHITFGGTALLSHLSEQTVSLWAEVLNAHPDSRLYLGYIANASTEVKARARELFAPHGLADRVSVWNTDYDHRANPSYFSEIDIFLDSTPVNSTLTLCHALWMGVPVISMKGPRRSAVVGASILNSAGKPEWIAEDADAFKVIVASLSGDLDTLASLRAGLRDEVKSSKLMDGKGYARSLEAAFTEAVNARRST